MVSVNPWSEALKLRTRKFAVDVMRFVRALPAMSELEGIKRQLVDAATSTADNYRSATRARSHAEFTSRLGTALDEADEAENWLTTLQEAETYGSQRQELNRLTAEAAELISILARSTITARENERTRRKR